MDFSWFGLVWCGLVWFGYCFINYCFASDLFLCQFHKELVIWKKVPLVFCQTHNPRFSFIMYCYWRVVLSVYKCWERTWRNLDVSEFSFLRKSTKRTSLIDAFAIFITIASCLLELRRIWYRATTYAILLRNYTHAFSPGVESRDHSYCCDFGKSLLKKTIFSL